MSVSKLCLIIPYRIHSLLSLDRKHHPRLSLQEGNRRVGKDEEGRNSLSLQLTACLYFCTYSVCFICVLLYDRCIIVCIVYRMVNAVATFIFSLFRQQRVKNPRPYTQKTVAQRCWWYSKRETRQPIRITRQAKRAPPRQRELLPPNLAGENN